MSNQVPQKKEETTGAPAWVMTFADLMSLLMCFFVLLLSFSELDLQKYKQIAGSMKQAFGVQRKVKAMDMPKGTSIIAQEFSPGRPSPSPLKQIQQSAIDDSKQTLEFTDAMTKKDGEDTDSGEVGEGSDRSPVQRKTQDEESKEFLAEGGDGGFIPNLKVPEEGLEKQDEGLDPAILADLDPELLEKFEHSEDTDPDTAEDAVKLLKALTSEVKSGVIEIETEGQKILVRILEKGSFPSGSASFRKDFLPVLVKLRDSLKTIVGQVVISGHTDDVPISTSRFRSNWDLSAARAVSVVHQLLLTKELDMGRFVVEGHGEAHPRAKNDSVENRAKNRRVELLIVQGEDRYMEATASELAAEKTIENPFATFAGKQKKQQPEPVSKTDVKLKELEERIRKFKDGFNGNKPKE